MSWQPTFQVVGGPTSSHEAQIKHLLAILRIKEQNIATLERMLETLRLESKFERQQLQTHIDALLAAQTWKKAQKEPLEPLKKRGFWSFWRRKI